MNFEQAAIMGLLLCMLIFYALERFRVEVVAVCGLAAAFVLGIVPIQGVFAGFSSPAVITVVEILLIVTVLARTQVIDRFAAAVAGRVSGERAMLAVLCVTAACVSVFMNNIGALALMLPVSLSVCARLDIPPARLLMPLSFATLLGGLCSLTGTPANLVVNDWKISQTGGGFGYFELGTVGAPVAAVGLLWIVFAAPRVFRNARRSPVAASDASPTAFLSEASVSASSRLAGLGAPEAEQRLGITIHGVVRDGRHVFTRREDIVLSPGDVLLIEASLECIDALSAEGHLQPSGPRTSDAEHLEAVVMPDSIVLGSRLAALESFSEYGVTVAALHSRRRRIEGRFEDLQLGIGDVVVLNGDPGAVREVAAEAGRREVNGGSAEDALAEPCKAIAA